jgi:UDP-3-O-[3-hydroxymyristoyl] N-acetylglucosamine deacetylase
VHGVAERAGHAMHTALVQKLLRDRSAWELAHRYETSTTPTDAEAADLAVSASSLQPMHA